MNLAEFTAVINLLEGATARDMGEKQRDAWWKMLHAYHGPRVLKAAEAVLTNTRSGRFPVPADLIDILNRENAQACTDAPPEGPPATPEEARAALAKIRAMLEAKGLKPKAAQPFP